MGSDKATSLAADARYVRIFDTTLRDGEQSPGATLTSAEKLEVARALSRLGVDIIEAGFPAASPDDFAAVAQIAETVGTETVPSRRARPGVWRSAPQFEEGSPPIICGLARAKEKDIDRAFEAVRGAKHPRIHTFLATSPIHREHKLKMSREEVVSRVRDMVGYARALCEDIEFSPEDAGRTEPEFLYEVLSVAIEAGARTLNIPDTVGFTTPVEFGEVIAGIKANVAGVDDAVISVHCHNDLGLATANALAGIENGARQAEVTINGIGERAGNTALEEVVMTLHTRKERFSVETGIDTTQLSRTSRLVSARTGMVVQPNKAIVGANAFAHEAGIHQDGMLKHQSTYEIMRPETVGVSQTRLVLGKHSGRHALGARLTELGYELNDDALEGAFQQFKRIADRKKVITDADLEALVASEMYQAREFYSLDALQVGSGTMGMPTATVRLVPEGAELITKARVGTGPVDAVFKAIDSIIAVPINLLEYSVHAVTEGIDALAEVTVRVQAREETAKKNPQHNASKTPIYYGNGTDTDVIVASARAYIAALNRLLSARESGAQNENLNTGSK